MKRLDDRSRMKREFHVRFCESLRRKFPRATRLCEEKKPQKLRPFLRQLKQALVRQAKLVASFRVQVLDGRNPRIGIS